MLIDGRGCIASSTVRRNCDTDGVGDVQSLMPLVRNELPGVREQLTNQAEVILSDFRTSKSHDFWASGKTSARNYPNHRHACV